VTEISNSKTELNKSFMSDINHYTNHDKVLYKALKHTSHHYIYYENTDDGITDVELWKINPELERRGFCTIWKTAKKNFTLTTKGIVFITDGGYAEEQKQSKRRELELEKEKELDNNAKLSAMATNNSIKETNEITQKYLKRNYRVALAALIISLIAIAVSIALPLYLTH
jgi:hypothetical protein